MSPEAPSLLYFPGAGPIPPVERIGGKAHHLARLSAAGLDVPAWFAVTTGAFDRFGSGTEPPDELRAGLAEALRATGLGDHELAVRSSAECEDAAGASFAGQFESVLGVRSGQLWEAVLRVWASARSARVAAYQGGAARVRMAVIVQDLIDPTASGVAFSVDPVTGDRTSAVVSAVYGLGEGLVSGELDADTYRVAANGAVRAALVRKERRVRPAPGGGTLFEEVPTELRELPTLSDEEARRIAAVARRLEAEWSAPQDIEWALAADGGAERRLYVLQARPVTALGPPGGAGERRVWDNSNIIESYAGVTTPLTFSFARGVYEEVYLQFCRVLGVSEALLEEHHEVFAHMLGLMRGRIYYNLLNWYRALSLLPGYGVNRAFMERMMGVRQKLEDPPDPPYVAGRAEDTLRLLRMLARLVREDRRLPAENARFHARVEAVLAPLAREDLERRSLDDLAALYRRLERDLLRQWRAPLVNDFFAMIWFGVLARMVEKWLPDAPPTLMNDLLCAEGGIISTEPARRVAELGRLATGSPALHRLFAEEKEPSAILARLQEPELAPFREELRAYLERFGDRCANELKLETVTLAEDPSPLLAMVRQQVIHGAPAFDGTPGRAARQAAEARAFAGLRGARRAFFGWVLRRTRARVRDRENLRFERTRVFGLTRRIFRALGARLARTGDLAAPRDVFYLTREEILGYVDGTGVSTDLKALVAIRRTEFSRYEREPAPPDRFETFGPPAKEKAEGGRRKAEGTQDSAFGSSSSSSSTSAFGPSAFRLPPSAFPLQGTGCCPGLVRGPVVVVRDPTEAGDLRGRILVAERTDPGWTLLFPAASGLLVQRGSLLSHSAIVAREVGLPCVVGIPGLLEALRTGDRVEMDGASGTVRRLGDEGP